MYHIDKKVKLSESNPVFPKSEILKELSVEQQTKYIRLDRYLENITYTDLVGMHFTRKCINSIIEPCDRLIFFIFLKNIFNKDVY